MRMGLSVRSTKISAGNPFHPIGWDGADVTALIETIFHWPPRRSGALGLEGHSTTLKASLPDAPAACRPTAFLRGVTISPGSPTLHVLRCTEVSQQTVEMGLVSRVTPVHTAMRNCTGDEGRSFEVGNQVLISSHHKLLSSKDAMGPATRQL